MSNAKAIFKDAMILTAITLVAGFLLGLVFQVTAAPREQAVKAQTEAAYKSVFADASSFEDQKDFDEDAATKLVQKADADYATVKITGVSEAKGSDGKTLGYVITVVTKSYGGDATLAMGITNEGVLNGYSITDISDTPGLGMKAKEAKCMDQFKNLAAGTLKVTKSSPAGDGEIEAISGATITSAAVTRAVNAGFVYFQSLGGGAK